MASILRIHHFQKAAIFDSLQHKQSESESESELLLVTRSNDNHSPGPVMREVSP